MPRGTQQLQVPIPRGFPPEARLVLENLVSQVRELRRQVNSLTRIDPRLGRAIVTGPVRPRRIVRSPMEVTTYGERGELAVDENDQLYIKTEDTGDNTRWNTTGSQAGQLPSEPTLPVITETRRWVIQERPGDGDVVWLELWNGALSQWELHVQFSLGSTPPPPRVIT